MSEINRYGISGGAAVQVASGYFPEGQSPSSLNDGSRTIMADVRRYVEQTTPETTATYSGGVYTLSLTRDLSAGELTQGFTAAFIAGSTNSASATLNINSTGAKNLLDSLGSHILGEAIQNHQPVNVVYDKKKDGFRVTDQLNTNVTIPDGGTIGSASDTDAITIASTGETSFTQNVGVGIADPVSFLHLEKSDATAYDATDSDGQVSVGPTIYLENPANANNTVGGQIVFGMRSTEEQARIGATGGSSPSLVFGTADAQRMEITNDGEVAMPLQPAWGARGTGTMNMSGTSSYTVVANSVEVTDIGGNYDTSTYQFTAPIDGTYYVAMSFCATTLPGVTGPAQMLYKNGSNIKELGINYSSDRFITITGIYILSLDAGDYIEQRVVNYNNVTVALDRSRGFFGGFLIG